MANINDVEEDEVIFVPKLSIQRKRYIADVLEKYKSSLNISKILDIGCNQGFLLQYLRPDAYTILDGIDKDLEMLKNAEMYCKPLTMHYLIPLKPKLTIRFFHGDVIELFNLKKNEYYWEDVHPGFYDAVVSTEVIEHVLPQHLPEYEQFIFAFLQPKIIIITTPNREFNAWFKNIDPNEFRDADHKFEWNRKEFFEWCTKMASIYPYSFEIEGVGKGPDDSKGHATQTAVFIRKNSSIKQYKKGINKVKCTCVIEYPQ